jgi:hypothetical protein
MAGILRRGTEVARYGFPSSEDPIGPCRTYSSGITSHRMM